MGLFQFSYKFLLYISRLFFYIPKYFKGIKYCTIYNTNMNVSNILAAKGGAGGKGNTSFKSSTFQVKRILYYQM